MVLSPSHECTSFTLGRIVEMGQDAQAPLRSPRFDELRPLPAVIWGSHLGKWKGCEAVWGHLGPNSDIDLKSVTLWHWLSLSFSVLIMPSIKWANLGTSLAVQWLRCCTSNGARVQSLVRELKSHMPHSQKKERLTSSALILTVAVLKNEKEFNIN